MFPKGSHCQMVELSLLVINEYLEPNCLLILPCIEHRQRAAPRGRRRGQRGRGIFDFVKKVAKNPLVRSLAKRGIEYAPGICHNLTKRVKNKTLNRILNSDAAHLVLNKAIKTANNHLQ